MPSTFCPTLGHHQGRIYYKSHVTFVLANYYCVRTSLPLALFTELHLKANAIIFNGISNHKIISCVQRIHRYVDMFKVLFILLDFFLDVCVAWRGKWSLGCVCGMMGNGLYKADFISLHTWKKAWIYFFYLQLWINSRTDWAF